MLNFCGNYESLAANLILTSTRNKRVYFDIYRHKRAYMALYILAIVFVNCVHKDLLKSPKTAILCSVSKPLWHRLAILANMSYIRQKLIKTTLIKYFRLFFTENSKVLWKQCPVSQKARMAPSGQQAL